MARINKAWNYNIPPLSCGRQITVKKWRNLPISNPKQDIYNINAHTKFCENYRYLLKISSGNESKARQIAEYKRCRNKNSQEGEYIHRYIFFKLSFFPQSYWLDKLLI